MVHFRQSVLKCCILAALLLGLWGCGRTPVVEGKIMSPSTQWQIIKSAAVQLEIPPGYVGGEPERQFAEIQATLNAWGFGDRLEWLEQNAEKIELLAFQSHEKDLNSINIVQLKRPPDLTLEAYLQQQTTQLQAAGIKSTIKASVLGDYLEIITDDLSQAIFVFPTDTVFWVTTYSSRDPNAKFAAMVERSQHSFQVLSEQS